MAKRKRLEMPKLSELAQMRRDEIARRQALRPMSAPISKVVTKSAEAQSQDSQAARVRVAQYAKDAQAYQDAEQAGRLLHALPLAQIDAGYMIRDRKEVSVVELDELKRSIAEHGLRMPVEVVALRSEEGQPRYGLISGFRRLTAMRMLAAEAVEGQGDEILAIIRQPAEARTEYAAMVEENEIREDLTHYERGRIVHMAVQEGVFGGIEDALGTLFAQASKAKRSKIRSFVLIHESLGDLLIFAHKLNERNGLALAAALKDGHEKTIRKALEAADVTTAEDEWAVIDGALKASDKPKKKTTRKPEKPEKIKLGTELFAQWSGRPGQLNLELSGAKASEAMREEVMAFLRSKAE